MLTNKQKFILSDLARQAWKLALARAGVPEDDFVTEKDFRHQEVARAVAKDGLCCCDQRDYKAVEAHFLALLGRKEAAARAQVRAASEPKRQAETVLNKCSLAEAAPNQLWRLVYTIRNRGAARGQRETPAPASQPVGKLTYIIKKH